METKIIFIRTDANEAIGIGHLMRCLTVARCLLEKRVKIYFLVSDEYAADLLREQGFEPLCLNTVYHNMTLKEAFNIQQLIYRYNADAIIVDSYYITTEYLECLQSYTQVICFFYMEKKLPVDILINYNINFNFEFYKSAYANSSTKLLLGSKYVPLRREFTSSTFSVRPNVQNILLMTGGADPCNFMGIFLRYIKENSTYSDLQFTCISGKYNVNYVELLSLQDSMKNLNVVQTTQEIAQLMQQSDIVLSAGGTTLYELCSVGVPTILFSFADNQIAESRYMQEHGIAEYAGAYGEQNFWRNLFAIFDYLIIDIKKREIMSEKMRSIVDGKGANRISNKILHIIEVRRRKKV